MKKVTVSLCLTIVVLLGSIGPTKAKGFGLAMLLESMEAAQAKGFGEFVCQNFQTININDSGEIVDQDLATEAFATKFVITKRKVEMTYPFKKGNFPIEIVHIGKWTIGEKGTHKFLIDESKGGYTLSQIVWTEYGLGAFRKYEVNRTRLSLYRCIKLK